MIKKEQRIIELTNTGCPSRNRTRHFFNNSNTNEDIATKFEQEYVRCVRNEEECVCSVPNVSVVCVCSAPNVSVVRLIVATFSHCEIQSFFGDRVISKGFWPPRSPDLTPPDYFLWGYLKGRVYQNKPRTIDALKANITEEIQAVIADVLARTFQNMARRVQSYLDANSGNFQNVMMSSHFLQNEASPLQISLQYPRQW